MRIKLLVFLLSFLSFSSFSQTPWCGSNHEHDQTDGHKVREAMFETYYQKRIAQAYGSTSKKETKYIIPVVFHVIHENGPENVTLEALQGLIDEVNGDLAATNKDTTAIQAPFKGQQVDCEIELRMAKVDPEGTCTNGVTRTYSTQTNDAYQNVKTLARWPNDEYLNIWIVKSIEIPWGQEEGTITLGYAQFPGGDDRTDGIVMRSDRLTGNTLTHELGHYLNLYHTFQGGCGRSCNTSGDRICDTPPTAEANYGCPKGRNSCSNDSPDGIDMISNYMDYSNCSAMFTEGQKLRMQSALDIYRSELVSDGNLENTGTDGEEVITEPIADFYADKFKVCAGESITFNNSSCNHAGSSTFKWEFDGPEKLESTEQYPEITFNQAGQYSVKLTITNAEGSDSKTVNDYLEIGALESELTAPYTEGFNSITALPWEWEFEADPSGFSWKLNESNGFKESQGVYVSNYGNSLEGIETSFILPPLNISENEDKYLRYRVSYARASDLSADVLQVSVSIDCGESWRLIQSDVSSRLMTTANQASSYFPSDESQWAEKEIDLSRYDRFKNLQVKFTFISGNGNNIFMDDIRVGSKELGGIEQSMSVGANIFPNPAKGFIQVQLPSYSTVTSAQLVDLSGKILWTRSFTNANTQLDLEGVKPGIYQLVLLGEGSRSINKIVIE